MSKYLGHRKTESLLFQYIKILPPRQFYDMMPGMSEIFLRWKKAASQKRFWLFCFFGLLFLASAFLFTVLSGKFADSRGGASLSDLLLDRLPVVNLDFLNTWGFLFIVFAFALSVAVYQPGEIPFVLISVALFASIRSGFIALTYIGAPADILKLSWDEGFLRHLSFTNDLFFSGHTGLPFLAFLLVRKGWVKKFFLGASFVMGTSVLLTHTHYSIDVFAAFFITYAIFKISERFFGHLRPASAS